jgi:hypothetical protein
MSNSKRVSIQNAIENKIGESQRQILQYEKRLIGPRAATRRRISKRKRFIQKIEQLIQVEQNKIQQIQDASSSNAFYFQFIMPKMDALIATTTSFSIQIENDKPYRYDLAKHEQLLHQIHEYQELQNLLPCAICSYFKPHAIVNYVIHLKWPCSQDPNLIQNACKKHVLWSYWFQEDIDHYHQWIPEEVLEDILNTWNIGNADEMKSKAASTSASSSSGGTLSQLVAYSYADRYLSNNFHFYDCVYFC